MEDHTLIARLREETAQELAKNAGDYASHPIILKHAGAMGGVDTVLESLLGEDVGEGSREERVRREGELTKTHLRWSSLLHVFALASIIGLSIQSYFPSVPHYAKQLYDCKVDPILIR